MKIKRCLAALLVCIFIFNIFPPVVFAESPDFTIAGEDTEAEIGTQALVNINLSNNTGFSVLNLYYTYNEDYFTLKEVKNKAWPLTMMHEKTTVWDGNTNYEADGTLATLVFDVAEDTPYGTYEIGIHLLSAANTDLEYVYPVTVNATVTVTPIKVKGVDIFNSDITLDVGAMEQLVANVTPNEAADKSVVWHSADNSVATVDQNGVVTGVGYGTTEIIVTTNDGGYTDRCKVSVNCPHRYAGKVIAPTYLEHGYTIYTCEICGHSYSDNFVDPLERTPIDQADISLEYTEAFYEGKPLEPQVYISYQGERLDAATELKVTYSANDGVGVGTVTVEGINRFVGTVTLTFTVTYEVIPEPIVNVSAISDYGKILLSWGRSSEVATNTYRIYRAAEGEAQYTLIKTIVGRDTVSFEDVTVKKGVAYTYYVTGVGAYGAESEPSVIAGATALVDVTAPVVLKMSPAENAILAGATTFTAVAEDNVGVHRGYYEYSLDGDSWKEIGTTYDSGLSIRFTVDFDTDVTVMYIRLTVYDAEGNASAPKIAQYVVDNVGPDKVTGLSAVSLSSKLTLSWNDVTAADAQYFILQQQTEDGWRDVATNITTLGYTVTGLTPGTTYCYRVACVDKRGNVGTYSDAFYATTAADTAAPVITEQGPASARYNHAITYYATARDDSDIRYIYIEVSTDLIQWTQIDCKEFTAAASKQEYTSTIDLTGYAEGSLYVRAVAEDFSGNRSNTDASAPYSEYIVDKTAPAAPENVTASGQNGYISIFWTMGKESDLDTYTVYRSLTLDGGYTPVSSSLTALSYHDTAVEAGVTYFYKVVVSDRAGNISDYSAVVWAAMSDDTQKPEITSIGTTSNQTFGPHMNTISVSAVDNNHLSCLLVEYCTSRDLEYKVLLKTENIAASYINTQVTLPVEGLTDGDVMHIRVSAVDVAGLSSGYMMTKLTYDSTAPGVTDLSAAIQDNKITLTWQSQGAKDLSGFRVYRSTDGVTYTLLGYRGPSAGGSYTFTDTVAAKESATFTYKVEAVDVLQNAASQTVAVEYVYIYQNTPPTAVITKPSYMMAGSEELFDASASSDDLSIQSYHWDFGDGTTSDEKKPVKKYAKEGTYTVTLTVTDNGGLTDTAQVQVVVDKQDTLGVLNVAVLDENNNPVPYVPVYFDLGSGNQRIVNTNGSGIATMKLSQGTHVVGMYATGYLPVKKDVVVLQNATRTVTLTTVKEELVTGEFEITRMTFDEIVAAGIDVYDSANRNVYSATVRVFYGSTPPISVSYVRNDSQILDYKIYDYNGKEVDEYVNDNGETRHIAGVSYIGDGSGYGGGGGGDATDIIAIIDIPAEASYLKEFFDVKLHIVNNALPEFTLVNNVVTLNVPDGMFLMDSVSGGYLTSPTVEIESIQGQQTKTLAWVLRGDVAGEYDLSADFTGTLSLFNAPVNTRFETKTPIKVYGLEGVTFRVLTASEIYNETLYFNIELENNRDIDIYAPAAGLTDKIKNVTESVLNQNPKGDFYVQSHVLNVYVANENGAKQYVPFTFDANNNVIAKVDVLAPGQKIVYEYVAYNAIDYDGVAYFQEAVVTEFEGLAENIEVGSFEKQRYSFTDYSEKLDAILSGGNNETVQGYRHLLDDDEFYYSSATGGYFAEQCEKLYKSANLILNFDLSTLTQEEEREMIQAIILTVLSDSSVVQQSEDLLMVKYSEAITGVVESIRDGMVSTFQDSESTVKDITDACADILKDKRELAIVYRTEGRDAFLAELNKRMAGYALGITVDVVDYLSPSAEASCFGDLFGDAKDVVSGFFNALAETEREAYYYAVLKKQCDSQISKTMLYALRDVLKEQLEGEMAEAVLKNLLPLGSPLSSLPDVGLGANTLAFQTVEKMITQLENDLDTFYEDINVYLNLLEEAGVIAAEKILQKVFATAIGSTTFGVISAAFNIADAIFGFGDYVKQQDTFEIYNALSGAFLVAHLDSIKTRGSNADFNSMLYLRALCEMRLSGEAQYKKFMSDYIDGVYFLPIDEDIVLYYINIVKGTGYTSYDKWGDDLQYSVVRPRDLIFNIESTQINIPRAPVVSLNYETLTTEQSFTDEYEYCFADGVWNTCDGNPIAFTVGEVPSVIRVRKAAGDENLAGEITTVKIFAQKELSKLINVRFDGVNYIVSNLSSEYRYEILFVEEPDAPLDWSKAKSFAGSENVLKGVAQMPYAVIRSCHNVTKGETASKPLTLAVSSKSPLDLVIQGNGTVSQSGVNGCYYNGEQIDLIATPNDSDEFDGWYVNGVLVSTDRYYIAEMADDLQIAARFSGKTISDIQITAPPKKITYYEGESLDLNGLELTVNYTNAAPVMFKLRSAVLQSSESTQSIAEQYTAYLSSNTAGTATVVVNYGGQIATFEIEILHNTVEYVQKEATCGAEGVHATYCTLCQAVIEETPIAPTGDHHYEWVVDEEATCGAPGVQHEECTGCHAKRSENTPIAATGDHAYDDAYDTTCNGCDHVRAVESIAVADVPEKQSYLEAKDALDITGGKITLTYDDGAVYTIDMTDGMVSGFDNTEVGEQELLVTYGGKTTTFTVKIEAKSLTHIEVTTMPDKQSYFEEEQFDKTGMVVMAHYNNGTSDEITDYEIVMNSAENGTKNVVVSYDEKTTSFEVAILYTVVFENWDGTVLSTNTYYWGDEVEVPADPTKEADNTNTYAFAGWDQEVVNCAGDATYKATYTSTYINYTVKFLDEDGTPISEKTYHWGDEVEVPADPTKEADNTYTYTFAGWDQEVVNCAGNATYTATYTSTYINYTVKFLDEDGTPISEKTYHWGDEVEVPADPTKEADNTYTYTFAGWDQEVVDCAGDATYTATYTSTYINYTVKFLDEDGTPISEKTYHWGDEVEVPADPTKTADNTYTYTFAGWDQEVVDCAGDATYTATYTSTYINYTVKFLDEDGTPISEKTYHWGDEVEVPADPTKEADNTYTYAFAGWDKEVVDCAGDATYTATYTSTYINYTVKFLDEDGTPISEKTYHWGDEVEVPADPTKEADNTYTYTFAGWDQEVVNCAGDATYKATYTSTYINYTVKFLDEDGTPISEKTYHWGDKVEIPADPTKEADNTYTYAFAGWDKEVVDCAGDATYTATYTSTYINYTVKFLDEDGTPISEKTYHWGDEVEVPADPTKEADNTYTYAFAGWDKEVVDCAGDATYTATYTSTYINYTVKFLDEDGTPISEKTYHWGDEVEVPADPTKEADNTYTYTFAGWDQEVVNCAGDATYKATYTSTYINYTVKFLDEDGTPISEKTYHWGDEVEVPADPTKEADNTYTYTFAGWDQEVVNCAGDATYKATYTSTYINYTVKFLDEDGTPISEKTYHWGDKVEIPADPTKEADNTYTYAFAGWDKEVVDCAGDATYTATYTSTYINYTVKFLDEDGTPISEKTYHWGDMITMPAEPTKQHEQPNVYYYAFTGWSPVVVACAGDATYTATYEARLREYTVEFKDWNNTVIFTQKYHWGEAVELPADSTRAADNTYTYAFAGWDKEVVNCAGDATYKATYTSTYIDYIVVFQNWDGTELSKKTYHYGEKVTVPPAPTRPNDSKYSYTFTGWNPAVVKCAGNATYTAVYSAKSLVPSTITSSQHTVSGGTISKIGIGTTAGTLLGNLVEGSYAKVYQENQEVAKSALIGTGMTVKIMDGNTVKATATIVVTGDTNGDGKLSITDMLATKAHLLKKSSLSGASGQAADTNGDGGVSITDFIQMKAHILGKSKVEPKSTVTVVQTSAVSGTPEAEQTPVVATLLGYIQPDAFLPEKKPLIYL